MATNPTQQRPVTVDEHWLEVWVAWGFRELGHLLSRHAAYCEWMKRHGRGGEE